MLSCSSLYSHVVQVTLGFKLHHAQTRACGRNYGAIVLTRIGKRAYLPPRRRLMPRLAVEVKVGAEAGPPGAAATGMVKIGLKVKARPTPAAATAALADETVMAEATTVAVESWTRLQTRVTILMVGREAVFCVAVALFLVSSLLHKYPSFLPSACQCRLCPRPTNAGGTY